MFLVRLMLLPFRVGFRAGRLATVVSYRTTRFVGVRRMVLLGLGVAVGIGIAPVRGAETRARVLALLRGTTAPTDDDLGDRVRFELSHASTTWHLPQPDVVVAAGVVTLSGSAPHHSGRADLERAAASVPGIARVDNRMELAGSALRN